LDFLQQVVVYSVICDKMRPLVVNLGSSSSHLYHLISNREIGIIDVQMDNLVDELTSEGYIKKLGRTKIYLTDDGRKRAEL